MKYYTSTTEFNCGIDLHARQMYACVMDHTGTKLMHTNIQGNDFTYFLKRVEPYRHDLTGQRQLHLPLSDNYTSPFLLSPSSPFEGATCTVRARQCSALSGVTLGAGPRVLGERGT